MDWHDYAACVGIPTDMFFPVGSSSGNSKESDMVKQVCYGCPVRKQCLSDALYREQHDTGNRHGIWGGLSPRQRRDLWFRLQQQKTVTDEMCGSNRHVMDESNVYVAPSTGFRSCRACHKEARARWYEAKRRSPLPVGA